MHAFLSNRKTPPPIPAKILRRRRIERRSDEYVFASNGVKCPHITNAQSTVEELSRMADAHVHVHSLRRTFDDIAMECKVDGDVRRMLLNHINGDVHARHYSNGARAMTGAVEAISKWIVDQSIIAEQIASGSNVIPFLGKTG
jgi:integrase